MLKVCYIITKLELGGAQKVALYTAYNINENDFSKFLICGDGGILNDEAEQNIKTFKLKNLVREVSPIKDFCALIGIYKILKREKPDIVHTHSSKAGVLGRIAAKLAGVKIIIHTIHGYGFNETQKFFVKFLYVYLEKCCAFITDKLITVTKEDIKKGLLYKIAPENKFTLIRAAIDRIFFNDYKTNINLKKNLSIDERAKIVITIGPFKPQKNLSDFIRAAAIVCQEFDNVKFIIIGDGEQKEILETLSLKLGISNNLLFLGWRNDIIDILHISDIFALTSLWEGLPRTVVEAMLCDIPVIANAVDGIKEIIEDGKTGLLTKPYDYKATASKILLLLKDNDLRISLSKKAKESIKKEFDLDYTVRQQEDLYLQLSEQNK